MNIQSLAIGMILLGVNRSAIAQDRTESALCRESVLYEKQIREHYSQDLLVHDSYLYVVKWDGLDVYNVHDPANPVLVRELGPEMRGDQLGVYGDNLIVNGTHQAVMLDISNPTNPVELSRFEFDLYLRNSEASFIDGPRVLLSNSDTGLVMVDFSDPDNPVESTLLDTRYYSDVTLKIHNSTIFYGDSELVYMYDFSDRQSVNLIGELREGIYEGDLTFIDDYLYWTGFDYSYQIDGTFVYDIEHPENPQLVEILPERLRELNYNEEDRVGVTRSSRFTYTYDFTNPLDPELISLYEFHDYNQRNTYADGVMYSITTNNLTVIDPYLVGESTIGGIGMEAEWEHLKVRGNTVFVISYELSDIGDLFMIDVTNPELPFILDVKRVGTRVQDVHLDWPLMYTALRDSDLQIFDVSDGNEIELLGEFDYSDLSTGDTNDVTVVDQTAYIANTDRLLVVDVSNPSDAVVVNELEIQADSIHAHEDWLFVIEPPNISAYNISDRANPQLVQTLMDLNIQFSTLPFPDDMVVYNNRLFTENHTDVYEFAFNDSDSFEYVGFTELLYGGAIGEIQVVDDQLFVLTGSSCKVLEIDSVAGAQDVNAFSLYGHRHSHDFAVAGDYAYMLGIFDFDRYPGMGVVDLSSQCADCPADLNGDTVLNYFDVAELIRAYLEGEASADLNTDGNIDFMDVSLFMQLFNSGCPA